MSQAAAIPGPDLHALFALFPPVGDLPDYEFVPGEQVPEPYHGLLVHRHHMTVTVESFHGDKVDVKVLAKNVSGDHYARKILLALHQTGKIVQFGIMRVHFRYCSPAVQEAIVAEQTPLGRILIEHDVLRWIEPTRFLRVHPCPALKMWFGLEPSPETYGRLAIIHCNLQPAVELLEIVAPVGVATKP